MSIDIPKKVGSLIKEMDKVVIGYADVKRLSIAALLADMHVLLEGMPGTAKSLFVDVFQSAIRDSASARLQMTPDVKPMDIAGVKVYNPGENAFIVEEGPLCGKNFVLIDEINRTPPKTLSALLSAMQERIVVISGHVITLPDPYFVMATENPIEQEGVYPLPEAQLDRFAMKIIVPYASRQDELDILDNEALDSRDPQSIINEVISIEEIVEIREFLKKNIFVSSHAREYIVDLVRATRPKHQEHDEIIAKDQNLDGLLKAGCSARATMALRSLARVLAALDGRNYVLPKDIQEVALPVMRHRAALTYDAQADEKTTDDALNIIMEHVDFHGEEKDYTQKV